MGGGIVMNQATRRSRQTAIRLFAQEYMDADLPEEGAGEYDPSFVITKLGAKVNRALVGGVIDRVERRETESGSFYTAHLRDPTGTHRFEVASFQPELHADIEEILNRFESGDRFLMLLVGRARWFETEDGGMFTSFRPAPAGGGGWSGLCVCVRCSVFVGRIGDSLSAFWPGCFPDRCRA